MRLNVRGSMENIYSLLSLYIIIVVPPALTGIAMFSVRPVCNYVCTFLFRPPRTACGVDSNRGPKIFLDVCLMRKSNYCNHTDYRPVTVKKCMQMFPKIKYEVYKFEDVKDYHGESNV